MCMRPARKRSEMDGMTNWYFPPDDSAETDMGKHEGDPKDKPYEPDPSRKDDKDGQGQGKGGRGK